MNKTAIEWTDYTWNPVTGCSPVSAGCANCYARRMSHRLRGRCGYPADEPFRVTLHPERLEEPLRRKKSQRIFVCSMGDLFHPSVESEWLQQIFRVMMFDAPWHIYLILTKRPARMLEWFRWLSATDACKEGGMPRNIWPGVTCENQATADERIPILLQTLAAVRWVSVEPMLEEMEITRFLTVHQCADCGWTCHHHDRPLDRKHNRVCPACGSPYCEETEPHEGFDLRWGAKGVERVRPIRGLDWIVCGGETGPNARPMHPDRVRSLRDQAVGAGVPFLFKGWGDWVPQSQADEDLYLGGYRSSGIEWPESPVELLTEDNSVYRVGKKHSGRLLDGRTWDEYPALS